MTNRSKAQNLWTESKYYKKIAEKENFSHPGYLLIKKYSKTSTRILDVGCGDGSKLNRIGNNKSLKIGCELSQTGVKIGKEKFPQISFICSSGEKLPFSNNNFDITTCLFVIEHTNFPEKVISEVVRVTRRKGLFFFMAPNFGAPNRASPNHQGSRLTKIILGFAADFFHKDSKLRWKKVEPKKVSIEEFNRDDDTTTEPYQLKLLRYLKNFNIQIMQANTHWEKELKNPNFSQKVFRALGERGFFPFKHWGPHLFIAGRKI